MCLVRVTLFLLCHFDGKGLKSKCQFRHWSGQVGSKLMINAKLQIDIYVPGTRYMDKQLPVLKILSALGATLS